MEEKHGEWIMRGCRENDPTRIRTAEELMDLVDTIGFLPLFANEVAGFSAEERVVSDGWWTGLPECDPWEWRKLIAESGRMAYGKFFRGRAGFISKEWFPHFANCRRDGYDFDSRWEDGLASLRARRIMEQFEGEDLLLSSQLKRLAGFGKEGFKNFEGAMTELQMQTYLLIRGFRRRTNKAGEEYGWPVSLYSTPEALWGYEHISSAYSLSPAASGERILCRMQKYFPDASERDISRSLSLTGIDISPTSR